MHQWHDLDAHILTKKLRKRIISLGNLTID